MDTSMSLLRCLVRFSVVLLVLLPKEDPTVEEEVKKNQWCQLCLHDWSLKDILRQFVITFNIGFHSCTTITFVKKGCQKLITQQSFVQSVFFSFGLEEIPKELNLWPLRTTLERFANRILCGMKYFQSGYLLKKKLLNSLTIISSVDSVGKTEFS